jgi:hypothetical protein
MHQRATAAMARLVAEVDAPLSFSPSPHSLSRASSSFSAQGAWSKWIVSPKTARYVGRAPTYLPYFYYQEPADTYPGATQIGSFYSTPAKGACLEGQPLSTAPLGCTWQRRSEAQLIYGQQLLAAGWNSSSPSHWPLHKFGPNTTVTVMQNQPIFDSVWDGLAAWQSFRCCGC